MTELELQYKEALEYFGFEIKEITKRDLDFTYRAYEERMNPKTTIFDGYKDGKEYEKMQKYYELLSDIRKTNEVINNILNPKEEKKPDIIIENPEIVDSYEKSENNFNYKNNYNTNHDSVKGYSGYQSETLVDRPRILSLLLSLLLPIYGIIISIATWRIAPKSAKWYLVFGIIGSVLSFVLEFFFYYFYLFR